MKEQEIKEGNKLIAIFMDLTENNNGLSYFVETQGWTSPLNLLYDTSWDWLMPVIEKITEIDITPAPNWSGYRIEIVPRGYVKISGFPMHPSITTNVSIEGSLINAVYKAVVEFIKWYNENK